jgi:hypothetical protein
VLKDVYEDEWVCENQGSLDASVTEILLFKDQSEIKEYIQDYFKEHSIYEINFEKNDIDVEVLVTLFPFRSITSRYFEMFPVKSFKE